MKTASCGLKAGWDVEDEPYPQVGSYSLVLDWQQNPVCVIQLASVEVCPFNQVSEEFAYAEGEGDRTYAGWKAAHIKFFEWYANEIGVVFSPESELVLERFKKVYPS
ncbi:ASCH domain-containing protein [Vibrio maritimus]|uniref:ASCH domain-containing protein n=1 Tax=Vibrio maritimus TaxID=990268 RepID=UPI003736EB2F